MNNRDYLKIHKNTKCIKVVFDTITKKMVHTNQKYETENFTKVHSNDIVYDDHVLSCFYQDEEHPKVHIFGKHFIKMSKLFSQYGMTVLTHYVKGAKIHLLIVPRDKVKIFKE